MSNDRGTEAAADRIGQLCETLGVSRDELLSMTREELTAANDRLRTRLYEANAERAFVEAEIALHDEQDDDDGLSD